MNCTNRGHPILNEMHSRQRFSRQHTATHYSTLYHSVTATHCNAVQLQHTATLQVLHELSKMSRIAGKDAKSHVNTLQHTATHCYTL